MLVTVSSMSRRVDCRQIFGSRCLVVLTMGFLVAGPSLPLAQVIRSEVEAVRVDVTVTNRDGIFRSGLTADDFEVLDNGRIRILTGFSNTPSALNIVLMLDMSDSMMPHVRRLGAAATAFVQGLKEGDRAAIRSLHTPGILRSDIQSLHEDLSLLTLGERSSI